MKLKGCIFLLCLTTNYLFGQVTIIPNNELVGMDNTKYRKPKTSTNRITSTSVAFPKGELQVITFSFNFHYCVACVDAIQTISQASKKWNSSVPFNYSTVILPFNSENWMGEELVSRTVIDEKKWTFPIYIDKTAKLFSLMGFKALPITIILDKKGNICYTYMEGDPPQSELDNMFSKLKELSNKK